MKRSGRFGAGLIAVAGLVVLGGCRDNGLPDRNLPLQEARQREYGYPVYERTPDSAPVTIAGAHWMPALPLEEIPSRLLVEVGAANGTPVYALRGADAPYSRLYSPAEGGRWRLLVRLN